MEKCGFTIIGEANAYANARGEEVGEYILELRAPLPGTVTLDRIADLSDADREGVHLLSRFRAYGKTVLA